MRCGFSASCFWTESFDAGRVGDVKPALLVQLGDDRSIDKRRPGDAFDREARRQSKRAPRNRDLDAPGRGFGRGDAGRQRCDGKRGPKITRKPGRCSHGGFILEGVGRRGGWFATF